MKTGLSSIGSAAAMVARKPGAMVMVFSSSAGDKAAVEAGAGLTAGGQASAPTPRLANPIKAVAKIAR